jgi:uncharacterized protein DUF4232
MAEFEDRLRQTLRRRAAGVPPASEVPPGLVRRAEMRIARNLSAAVLSVALVAVGLVTGVNALRSSDSSRLATSVPACEAADLSGKSDLKAFGDEREGALRLINEGTRACSLQGWPVVRVLNASGQTLSKADRDLRPIWDKFGNVPPPGWPVVTLQPHDQAAIHLKWESSCSDDPKHDPALWEVEFPGGAGMLTFQVTSQDVPACVGETLVPKAGPFEPYAR